MTSLVTPMKLPSLMVFQHVFFLLLVTIVLVLSSLLIGIIKRFEDNVYVLAPGKRDLMHLVHKHCSVSLMFVVVMIVTMAVFIFSYLLLMLTVAEREMHRYATLIQQKEKTEQAERKSIRKSDAFAKASHDIRASLAGIIGWIDVSKHDIRDALDIYAGAHSRGNSEIETILTKIETSLKSLDSSAEDLLGILNSVLDKSKIEAGKMVLENQEFDVAHLVEEVVDLFLPSASKKGLDVVLDPCDGSIVKFARARGDRGRLKQILTNLLSNAVKFTSEGQITVRAWVRKPSFKKSTSASHDQQGGGFIKKLLCFFNHKKMNKDDKEIMDVTRRDPDSLEFVFEVDDTGRGILKERQKSVFEDYVQVKEKALEEGGTGLGLGIVQSLVHLMRGEIGIVDKEIGEKGTCFRFNVVLSSIIASEVEEPDVETGISDQPIPSPKLNIRGSTASPKVEVSHVVLLINNAERRRIIQKFMERLGINVSVAERWELLASTLRNQKSRKRNHTQHSSISSVKSELGLQNCLIRSASCNSNFSFSRAKEAPLMSSMDGSSDNNILPLFQKKTSGSSRSSIPRGASSDRFIMLLIDTTAGPIPQLCKIVNDFKGGLPKNGWYCKVVWLSNPFSPCSKGINMLKDSEDIIKHKPLHGTCLYEVVGLLPECGGGTLAKGSSDQVGSPKLPSSSRNQSYIHTYGDDSSDQIVQVDNSPRLLHHHHQSTNNNVAFESSSQPAAGSNKNKPLAGKQILVAEDTAFFRNIVEKSLSRMGATVKLCENGIEALDVVRHNLLSQRKHVYDYILMDCQMEKMDGFEATREIRKEEKAYNVRIPIIALTGHSRGGEETRRIMEAGMDEHLEKTSIWTRLLQTLEMIDHNTRATRIMEASI